ncbi:MAG: septation ring formation regulator EzrA [Erysipelotrichaceae bacterium]|nr:septation ring formation regulator EzrA [Erysipelotrichaceae bacterium]
MSLNEVITTVLSSVWFYIAVGLLFLAIIYLIVRNMTKKKLMKEMQQMEVRYTEMKTIPLLFKLNKATALARMNQEVASILAEKDAEYDKVQLDIKAVAQLLADTDDLIELGKYSLAKKNNKDLVELLSSTENKVKELNSILDGILQQEVQQREQINLLKEEFRNMKIEYTKNSNPFIYSYEAIEERFLGIEKLFSSFEECMYASEFQKANDVKAEIEEKLGYLHKIYQELPDLLVMARGILPRTVDEVSSMYAQSKQKGVYLKHLQIAKNIEFINDSMKADLHALKNAEVEGIDEHLKECQKRLHQLLQQIEKENKSYDESLSMRNLAFADIDKMESSVSRIQKLYNDVSMRFGFENMEDTITGLLESCEQLRQEKVRIDALIQENTSSATSWLIALRELRQKIDISFADVKVIQEKLEHACLDESHAKTQLMKLYLIMNEMQARVRKHRLLSISESYEEDLKTAYVYVDSIENLLKEIPLNISLLNKTLTEAIDFIYRFYNNVNKILGSATMVEDAIVVGNRCRSTYGEVDMELTRAELAYRNGEYTKALSVAFKSLESVYPNSAETMIKNSAKKEA